MQVCVRGAERRGKKGGGGGGGGKRDRGRERERWGGGVRERRVSKVNWCFTPSQPVRLYQGGKREESDRGWVVCV